jgi:hypothetical protein
MQFLDCLGVGQWTLSLVATIFIHIFHPQFLPTAHSVSQPRQHPEVISEPETWKTLDGRLQAVLDWALGVADDWKAWRMGEECGGGSISLGVPPK